MTLPAGCRSRRRRRMGCRRCSERRSRWNRSNPAIVSDASVLGTVKIVTPLLEGPLEGQVFLGTPDCDPCTSADAADGNMLRIYIEAAGSGVRIKKEGRIYANPSHGTVDHEVRRKPRGPLRRPRTALQGRAARAAGDAADVWDGDDDERPGAVEHAGHARREPDPRRSTWIGTATAARARRSAPFAPSFSAGTSNPNAGQFSPLTLTFGREDREQDLAGIQVHMPPGLLGTLTGVPLCGEPQASLGTCGEASQIGSMTVAAGPGSHPFYEKGEIYLTGPYKGAPFGLSIVVPTVAGPFNLGNVVVRAQDQCRSDDDGVDGHERPVPAGHRRYPATVADRERDDRPAGVHLQPDRLRAAADQRDDRRRPGHAGATCPRRSRSSGCAGLHFGPTFKASTSGHDLAGRRGEPRREADATRRARSRTSRTSRSNSRRLFRRA